MSKKAPVQKSGTTVAYIDNIQGCGSTSVSSNWGGARNFRSRTSYQLNLTQCRRLIEAGSRADAVGLRFNRHWTVHYQNAGICEENATKFIGHLLKLARDYAGRHGGQFACIWVREAGVNYGGHVHILMHLSAGLPLKGRTRKWIELAGGRCVRKVSRVRTIAGSLQAADRGGPHYDCNVQFVRNYLLKGGEDEAGQALGLLSFGRSGMVVGKRCGHSQNIGKARGGTKSRPLAP